MEKIRTLQITCCMIAVVSLALLTYSGRNVRVVVDRNKVDDEKDRDESKESRLSFSAFFLMYVKGQAHHQRGRLLQINENKFCFDLERSICY